MAELTLSIPATNLFAPSSWGNRSQIKNMLDNIWQNYGKSIKFSEKNSRIPSAIILSFIAVESGGNPTAGSNGHITQGLMQWNRTYAKSQLEDEYAKKRMTIGERDKLAEYGITFDNNGKTRVITNADQIKPDLNILIGSILIGQLIDTKWGTDNGKFRLDRIIAVYNAGAYGTTGKLARLSNIPTAFDLAQKVNPITKSYIEKMLGKNGALDIATTDLKEDIS